MLESNALYGAGAAQAAFCCVRSTAVKLKMASATKSRVLSKEANHFYVIERRTALLPPLKKWVSAPKVFMSWSKQETIQKHRAIWHWIADETRRRHYPVTRDEYPQNMMDVLGGCYCCHYASQPFYEMKAINCWNCPIVWPDSSGEPIRDSKGYFCERSYRKKWRNSVVKKNWITAARWAEKIAELPECIF